MGNCLSGKGSKSKRAISICMVGLDNAGKTTAVKGVQGASVQDVAPTIGFSSVDIKSANFAVTLIDLGGGRRIRDIWKNYLAEVYAIIYVLDSSDAARIEESKEEFTKLLSNPLVQGKPVLLLANKQDKVGALNEPTICEALDLHTIVNEYKCPCRVELCAAITSKPGRKNVDKNLKAGFDWLLQVIEKQFETLDAKVTEDKLKQEEEERIQLAERNERVKKIREERERKAQENENITPTDNLELTTMSNNEQPQASARSLRSGLGDQLIDDNDDITIPGMVTEEDSCTESQQRVSSRLSQVTCTTPSQAVVECNSSASTMSNGNGRLKKNKISPVNDLPTLGKLAPLNSLPKDPSIKNTLDYAPLPALNKPPKPNFDSDEDIVV